LNFSRSHRLTTKADYKALFDKANKINQRCLLILFKPNQKSNARLGLVVGKRAINSAVIRNRTKRILRESFRENQQKLVGLDIVVIVKKECNKLNKQKLREGIDQLWEKLLARS
jgi:ribonuclease P protein component